MTRLADFVVGRPGLVLLVAMAVAAASWTQLTRLTLRASKLDFLPPDDPAVSRYREFNDEFGALNAVLLLVEGPDASIKAFADEAAPALAGLTRWVRSVTYRIDRDRYEAQGLQLQTVERLGEIFGDLMDAGPLFRSLARAPTARGFVEFVTEEMADEDAIAPDVPEMIDNLAFIRGTLDGLGRVLAEERPADLVLFGRFQKSEGEFKRMSVDPDGYLISSDGQYLLMMVNPAVLMNRDHITEAFLRDYHRAIDPILARHPGVRVGEAGGPIHDLEEENSIDGDLKTTSVAAGIVIFLLSVVAFGGILPAVLILVALLFIVVYAGAATRLLVGHLNLISTVFVAILFGLGHDFGSYLVILSREWSAERGTQAIRDAIVTAGSSLFTAALTTAAAFYTLGLHDFVAFRELGIIAGTGVLLSYAVMLTVFPAMLVLRERVGRRLFPDAGTEGGGEDRPNRKDPAKAVDWQPLKRFLVWMLRGRRATIAIVLVGLGMSLPCYDQIPFEYDLYRLMPQDGPTVARERLLAEKFGIRSDFNVMVSKTMDEVHRIRRALGDVPSVSTIDSIGFFIPRDQEAKKPVLERIGRWASWVGPIDREAPVSTAGELTAALGELGEALRRPRRLANMAESPELHRAIDDLEATIGPLLARIPSVPDLAPRLEFMRERIADEIGDFRGTMWRASRSEPYTLETLPEELRQRYIGKHGSFVTYVTSALDLSTEANSRRFYEECRAVDPAVTGVPVVAFRAMSQIKDGWVKALGWAMLGIVFMVLIDFRSVSLAFLAMLPLLCGAVLMNGSLYALGIKWNVLNSVALPILIGVGVDYGVNLIHRLLLEGDLELAVGSTGRAIVYAAATSCAGFGSLTLASHRGLASFGLTLFLGILFACLAAIFFLPALLSGLGRSQAHAGKSAALADPPAP